MTRSNIPHTKGAFPIYLMFRIIINMLYHCLHCGAMQEPLRTQLIEWHTCQENYVFDFAREIHGYCKTDVQWLKSDCIKFRNAFITDTGIDPFQSCTIACACMNVLRPSHVKPKSIGRVPVNGYRSLRNFSNKSKELITYSKKLLVFPTATPGHMAVKCF